MTESQRQLPIGVFDSGIGGLTVLRAICELLPAEPTIYLGDTARVPYGTKSSAVITRYALNNARFLAARGVKLLVIACNTASAAALPALTERLGVPVLGVIEPGARKASDVTRSGVIGVIGTRATVASGAYLQALRRCVPDLTVHQKPCPLFVPLAEEGWSDDPVTYSVARTYLSEWAGGRMDTLILGCTHYPVLTPAIQAAVGSGITLVDSASAVAKTVAAELSRMSLSAEPGETSPDHRYYVTDVPDRFREVGRVFLGYELGDVEQVDIEPS
ncbi:MAG TPA: glutamate racemase [Myxococcota bacterium]|nr:glutamate racemase [Myxococcota bacterium]